MTPLARTGRREWMSSGGPNRCPVCGRDTDDKCRRTADGSQIHCWVGDTFAPSPDLNVGDTIHLDGRIYALASKNAGFSGNSYLFVLHRERTPRPRAQTNRHQAEQRRQAQQESVERVRKLRHALHRALAAVDPEHASIAQFGADLAAVRYASRLLQPAEAACQRALREGAGTPLPPAVLRNWRRQISYQLADLERWDRQALGTPTPAEVAALITSNDQPPEVAA